MSTKELEELSETVETQRTSLQTKQAQERIKKLERYLDWFVIVHFFMLFSQIIYTLTYAEFDAATNIDISVKVLSLIGLNVPVLLVRYQTRNITDVLRENMRINDFHFQKMHAKHDDTECKLRRDHADMMHMLSGITAASQGA